MPSTARPQPRAELTRAEILRAAESVFAESGFAAARLEDVAQRVGIRRASIVYYFRDKRELYEAVLANLFGDLLARYEAILATAAPAPERVESVVDAWVTYVSERPTVARILLREAAEPSPSRIAARHIAPLVAAVSNAIQDGQQRGLFAPIDPIHFIFTVVGATVFFVAATPRLAPDWPFNPLSAKQLKTYRGEVLNIARRLLGTEPTAALTARRAKRKTR
ncbi:MAG: TetR/AcrR family transcriptional regulator [Candidatus Binatia bacterium]